MFASHVRIACGYALLVGLAVCGTASPVDAAPSEGGAVATPALPARAYVLKTHGGRVSLDAKEASLIAIVKELGAKLGIAVDDRLPKDEPVTAKFDNEPLADALRRLSANHALVANPKTGQIERIVLVPHAPPTAVTPKPAPSRPTATATPAQAPQQRGAAEETPPPPFEFEFDPSQVPEKPTEGK